MIIAKHENQLLEKYTKCFITSVKPDENCVFPENNIIIYIPSLERTNSNTGNSEGGEGLK